MINRTKRIFINQPWRVQLELNPFGDGITAAEVAAASAKQIQYKKPSASTWTSVTATQIASSTIIYYDVPSTTNDETGTWSFRALLTFTGDVGTVPGVIATQNIEAR